MAMYETNHGTTAILPKDTSDLVVQPVSAASTAFITATVVRTTAATYRVPLVLDDPAAAWVAEGGEIPVSDMDLDEIEVSPKKLAGLTIVSRELADDSSPAAVAVVQAGFGRDLAKKLDAAFYGALSSPAPSGLGALSGIQTAVGAYTNLDVFAEAISKAETVGATITSFVTDPATALALSKIKVATGSNAPLLGQDATAAGQRRILGVPLLSSPAVAAGVVWAYDSSRVWVVLRDPATVEVDRSVFFTSDRVAIKATLRAGFAFPHSASVVKITAA